MNQEQYVEMFEKLGLYCRDRYGNDRPIYTAYRSGRKLRHPDRDLPTIYFCTYDQRIYFSVRVEDSHHYPAHLWDMFRPRPRGERDEAYMCLAPREGMERRAFRQLIGLTDEIAELLDYMNGQIAALNSVVKHLMIFHTAEILIYSDSLAKEEPPVEASASFREGFADVRKTVTEGKLPKGGK